METFGGIIGAIITAVVVAILFYFILKIKGPWSNFWTFFLLLFLSIWAASLWVSPMGPMYWGVAWVPLIFIGIIAALLLAAIPIRSEPKNGEFSNDATEEGLRRKNYGIGTATLSGVFWMFMVILMIAVVIGYSI